MPKRPSRVRQFLWLSTFGVALLLAFFVGQNSVVQAQEFVPDETLTSNLDQIGQETALGTEDALTLVGRIINVVLGVMGILLVLLFVYAGLTWMRSRGRPEFVEKAKQTLWAAVIGTLIVFSAFILVNFIFDSLFRATGSGTGGSGGGGGGGGEFVGALQPNIVRNVVPARNANVARNTMIAITFREGVDPQSFLPEGVVFDDELQPFLISTVGDDLPFEFITEDGTVITNVEFTVSEDRKIYTFNPFGWSDQDPELGRYTVELSCDLEKLNGLPAFGQSCNEPGYAWNFNITEERDETPPTVLINLLEPAHEGAVAPNNIVSVVFSESMMPLGAVGSVGTETNIRFGFTERGAGYAGANNFVAGQSTMNGSYTEMQFVSFDRCGTNSCNESIYCMPFDDVNVPGFNTGVHGFLRTPTLPQSDPGYFFSGLMDMAGNPLDISNTPIENATDFEWSFETSAEIELTPPEITRATPANISRMSLNQSVYTVEFSRRLISSRILDCSPDNEICNWIMQGPDALLPELPWDNDVRQRTAVLNVYEHDLSGEEGIRDTILGEDTDYNPRIGNAARDQWWIQDVTQNCFQGTASSAAQVPSTGDQCTYDPVNAVWLGENCS